MLAERQPELLEATLALIPNCYGNTFYHIVVGQPVDQDFELSQLAVDTSAVIWVQLANPRPGLLQRFLQLRDLLFVKLVHSRLVVEAHKFTVARKALAGFDGTPFQQDNSRAELLLYTARSREDLEQVQAELRQADPAFLQQFTSTYECIVCGALSPDMLPEYFPPWNI